MRCYRGNGMLRKRSMCMPCPLAPPIRKQKTPSSWKLGIGARLLLYVCLPTLFICSVVRGEVLHPSLCLQQQPKRREKHTLWLIHHHPWTSSLWNHSPSTKLLYCVQKSYKSHLPKRLLVKVLHPPQSHSIFLTSTSAHESWVCVWTSCNAIQFGLLIGQILPAGVR